jgi:hypothetical protein
MRNFANSRVAMSKRRPGLKPRERDDWPTPWPAVVPLLPHLQPGTKFIEPCCGAGDLVQHLDRAGHTCAGAYDLSIDARTASYAIEPDTIFMTNVPWRRSFEPHKIIANLSEQRRLWALIKGGAERPTGFVIEARRRQRRCLLAYAGEEGTGE